MRPLLDEMGSGSAADGSFVRTGAEVRDAEQRGTDTVSVMTKAGRPVEDLSAKDFVVLNDAPLTSRRFGWAFTPPRQQAARAALEAWGLEAYCQRRLSAYQLRTVLGFPSPWDLDGFLKDHNVETYTLKEWEEDWANIQEFRQKQKT